MRKGCFCLLAFKFVSSFTTLVRLQQIRGYIHRIRILQGFHIHGASVNAHADDKKLPRWTHLLKRLCRQEPKGLSAYYVNIVELLLESGADPNLQCGSSSVTPWTQFLAWVAEYERGWKGSHHHEVFLARLIILMLKIGVDSTVRLNIGERRKQVRADKMHTQTEQDLSKGSKRRWYWDPDKRFFLYTQDEFLQIYRPPTEQPRDRGGIPNLHFSIREIAQTYFCSLIARRIKNELTIEAVNGEKELTSRSKDPEVKGGWKSFRDLIRWSIAILIFPILGACIFAAGSFLPVRSDTLSPLG